MPDTGVPLLIDGKPVTTGHAFQVMDPALDEPIATVACADESAVDAALTAAERAFPAWSRTPLAERKAAILDAQRPDAVAQDCMIICQKYSYSIQCCRLHDDQPEP